MNRVGLFLSLAPMAYLVGSIPFGLLVGLSRGVDPRKSGSGNIGATNVGRLLGGRFFALVFTLDLLKGALPVLAAGAILRFHPDSPADCLWWMLIAFSAVAGHLFSIFLGFRGGKGVATTTGVVLGVFPYFTLPGLAAAAVWFIVFGIGRIISLASILGILAFPLAYILMGLVAGWPVFAGQFPLLVFAVVLPGLIVWKHRSNISRLRRNGASLRPEIAPGGR